MLSRCRTREPGASAGRQVRHPDVQSSKWWTLCAGALLVGLLASCGASGVEEGPTQGWRITVYYTPVEQYHGGQPVAVRGHPSLTSESHVDLGSFPSGFVDVVREEGCGRISAGPHAGKYLNWSWNTGFWLDTSTRDSAGDPLMPFESAALDDVTRGTTLTVLACGSNDDGSAVNAGACDEVRAVDWVVRDEFTPGYGGERHVDLYLGEEDRPDFTSSPLWLSWTGADVQLEQPR